MRRDRLGLRSEGLEVGEDGAGIVFEALGPVGLRVLVCALCYEGED